MTNWLAPNPFEQNPKQVTLEEYKALGGEILDRSTHPNVVEYAVQEMMKRKGSPKKVAERVADKFNDKPNMFFGVHEPDRTFIDPNKLEGALWERMVDNYRELVRDHGFTHENAIKSTVFHFKQGKRVEKELQKRVTA